MTMPMIQPRLAPDVTPSPNAATVANASAQQSDGTAVAQFSAVLTTLLGNAPNAKALAASTSGTTATDTSDGSTEAGAPQTGSTQSFSSTVAAALSRQPSGESSALLGGSAGSAGDDSDASADGTVDTASGPQLAALPFLPDAIASSTLESAADAAIADATTPSIDATAAAAAASLQIAIPAASLVPTIATSADATIARRGLDLLAPEFRDRLERVIERMESEFGYKVEVSETFRSQSRQDALFAQGRTEPGQVVTWTRASNHTLGHAADLVIDGSHASGLPYDRLMRIAREEGLRTLGSRDPGHIELVSSSAAVIARPAPSIASQSSIVPSAAELESRAAGVSHVAQVATVAQVARVAQVAQVATVGAQTAPTVHNGTPRTRAADSARTGANSRRGAGTDARDLPPTLAAPVVGLTPTTRIASNVAVSGDSDAVAEPNGASERRARLDPAAAREGAADILRQTRDELMRAVASADPTATSTSSTSSPDATSGIGHADMSERIARLLKVQDAAGDRPLSQVMLRLERPDGGEDRLRVDLRGNSVSATLDVGDQGAADRLGANVKELQRALERHGFETDALTIRTATRAVESTTLSRAAGASIESDLQRAAAPSSSNTTNTSSRERGARHDEQRPSPDSQQRQRSRREQKGDR